jgi:hypothetical protein
MCLTRLEKIQRGCHGPICSGVPQWKNCEGEKRNEIAQDRIQCQAFVLEGLKFLILSQIVYCFSSHKVAPTEI